ncbi:MAG: proline dehydrogenase family protein [DPANN group archaeon]|nr:proline dehydrogenase family protein [DPANN group archaeon]
MDERAQRWVAGPKVEDALQRVKQQNEHGIRGIIDKLGEGTKTQEDVLQNVAEYKKISDMIRIDKAQADISIKLTSLGLGFDKQLAQSSIDEIVHYASENNILIWIDMEHSQYTDRTIEIFKNMHAKYPDNIAICLQAKLKRTPRDLEDLLKTGSKIRLCKGIYYEEPEVALQDSDEIRKAFLKQMDTLFAKAKDFGIATHDQDIIDKALKKEPQNDRFRLQMLMGVRDNEKAELAKKHALEEYIPYGEDWKPYVSRREIELKRSLEPKKEKPSLLHKISSRFF